MIQLDMAEEIETTEIKMVDGVFVKSMLVHRAGREIGQHSHAYDHLSMLAVGEVNLYGDGEFLGHFVAPSGITIRAGVKHRFETLTDGVLIYCIHNVARSGGVDIEAEHTFEERV